VGTFDSWSLTIESPTFPERYDGRAEDSLMHDSGICDVELLPGAEGLTLTVIPFKPGDAIVRYSVERGRDAADGRGSGTVRVTDCAGNSCDVPIELSTAPDPVLPEGDIACEIDDDCTNEASCIGGVCYMPKNRFISFSPQSAGEETAIRVTHVGTGLQWWVTEPDTNAVARLESTLGPTLYRDWGLEPAVIHVGDCPIVPNADYQVQAILAGANPGDEGNYSDALELPTVDRWGDVVGLFEDDVWTPPNNVGNLDDVMAGISKFQGAPTAPPKPWVDLDPEEPNLVINLQDILGAIYGFQSDPYPFSPPESCP
jgi:hypothetical protein